MIRYWILGIFLFISPTLWAMSRLGECPAVMAMEGLAYHPPVLEAVLSWRWRDVFTLSTRPTEVLTFAKASGEPQTPYLQNITANRRYLEPRYAYASWLLERTEPRYYDYGRFMQLQFALNEASGVEKEKLKKDSDLLLKKYEKEWIPARLSDTGLTFYFGSGMIELAEGDAKKFLRPYRPYGIKDHSFESVSTVDALFNQIPLRAVLVTSSSLEDIITVFMKTRAVIDTFGFQLQFAAKDEQGKAKKWGETIQKENPDILITRYD